MSYDTSFFSGGKNFRLIELETTEEGDGEIKYEGVISHEPCAIAILVEGKTDGIEILFNDNKESWQESKANSKETEELKLYVASEVPVKNDIIRLRLNVWQKVKKRIRISILVLFKSAKKAWEKISCTGCKKLIRFLFLTLAVHFGIPAIPAHGILPAGFWTWLKSILSSDVKIFLSHLSPPVQMLFSELNIDFLGKFIKALEWIVGFFGEVFEPIDKILAYICRKLGLCPAD